MAERAITFKVFRYKQGDAAPHYDTFTVTCDERTTVLSALQDIRRDLDPTLMLRHSCHHASCGTCGMRINGKEELGCVANVLELGTDTVVVEPLNNLPLIGDLVVDMEPFYDKYTGPAMPYIRHSEFLTEAEPPDNIGQFIRYENCIECGICVSACPIAGSDPAYLGPATLAAAWRVIEEPRNGNQAAALQLVDTEHGCWRCHVAYECTEVCPSNVDPAGSIMRLRGKVTMARLRRLFGIGK